LFMIFSFVDTTKPSTGPGFAGMTDQHSAYELKPGNRCPYEHS